MMVSFFPSFFLRRRRGKGGEGGGREAPSRFLFLLSIFGNVSIVVDRRGREEEGGGRNRLSWRRKSQRKEVLAAVGFINGRRALH